MDNNSAAAIGQVEKNLQGMGAAGTRAGLGVRQGFDQVGAGAISATEKTRLAAEEMGVRLPRAMISLISQSKLAAAALEAVTGAMIALATIQISFMIFGALYEGAKKLYEKWLDVNGAIQRYNDKAAEAAQQDFDKSRTLKQLNADLATATTEIDEFNRRKEVAQKWEGTTWSEFFRDLKSAAISIATLGTTPYKYHFSVADANALNALTGQSDIEKAGIEEKRHEKALREIRDNALVAESKVQGIDKARLVQKAADDEALEDTKNKFNVQNQLAAVSERAGKQPGQIGYVPRPGPHYFDEEQNDAYAHAAAEFQASVNSQRQSGGKGAGDNTAREIRRLQEEADEATLRGIDKLEYERKAADADWVSEHGRSAVAIAAIDKKYYAEESKLLDEQKKKIVDMLAARPPKAARRSLRSRRDLRSASMRWRRRARRAGSPGSRASRLTCRRSSCASTRKRRRGTRRPPTSAAARARSAPRRRSSPETWRGATPRRRSSSRPRRGPSCSRPRNRRRRPSTPNTASACRSSGTNLPRRRSLNPITIAAWRRPRSSATRRWSKPRARRARRWPANSTASSRVSIIR